MLDPTDHLLITYYLLAQEWNRQRLSDLLHSERFAIERVIVVGIPKGRKVTSKLPLEEYLGWFKFIFVDAIERVLNIWKLYINTMQINMIRRLYIEVAPYSFYLTFVSVPLYKILGLPLNNSSVKSYCNLKIYNINKTLRFGLDTQVIH